MWDQENLISFWKKNAISESKDRITVWGLIIEYEKLMDPRISSASVGMTCRVCPNVERKQSMLFVLSVLIAVIKYKHLICHVFFSLFISRLFFGNRKNIRQSALIATHRPRENHVFFFG